MSHKAASGPNVGDARLGTAVRAARPAPPGTRFRAATSADDAFFAALYVSTRIEELALSGWPEAMQAAFLAQQAAAQQAHYVRHYDDAEWWVLERHGQAIGRLILARWPSQHRIVDIALLPHARRGGLGGTILAGVIAEAEAAGKPVSIHVEKANKAMRLYRRLGFATVEDKGVYDLMLRPAGGAAAVDAADGREAVN
ncbi:GNAT family N-acetyltransferase [Aurantimonas sp. HBX-1]|uniref:GNAT family N-acetyltransferase n=1 Tax=Aurantimonas sp. HBX-1 TaxID=2906072 RepID=UPI001F3FD467|nr:GNAT family N-acetyltransferase [Aurantimonas sp. HBX-1]UIJ71473.1 GNAT family N-acetyltransferase [Aurantimonas sp. HBX-1]